MPNYSYVCAYCGPANIFQQITEKPLTSCPECGKLGFRKLFTAPAISFKGSGFASNDKGK
jgi:putative FmdB family regulatory protein